MRSWAGVLLIAILLLVPAAHVTAQPNEFGQWSPPFSLGVVGIHSTVLRSGRVLLFSYPEGLPSSDSTTKAVEWDPSTGSITDVSVDYQRDLFCAGQNVLANGTVFVAGGHDYTSNSHLDVNGVGETDVYDPITHQWAPRPLLGQNRWYPTNVGLGSGKTLVFGGREDSGATSDTVEQYSKTATQRATLPSTATKRLGVYPRMHLLPDGRIFHAGPYNPSNVFSPATNTWAKSSAKKFGDRVNAPTVLLPGLQKVLVVGGQTTQGTPATATTEIIDFSQAAPTWRYSASLTHSRIHANAVLLADGTVLVVGGGKANKYDNPVTFAELFDPVSETARVLAPQTAARMYHSTAVLLPDGRVLSAGQDNGPHQFTGEVFSPPYLFLGPRPTAQAPASVGYNESFSIASGQSSNIRRVALVRPGSVTHTVNTEQRYVDLSFSAAGTTITASSPPNAKHAPPGYYMLFVVDSNGVPSVANWVRIG